MRRRDFILSGIAITCPFAARAQQPDRMRLIGVLMGYAESDRIAQSWLTAFRGALTKLGWTEGNNLRIEVRWSAGDADRMRTSAKELASLRPDVIFGVTTPVVGALSRETRTIPIVFTSVSDPIGSGFAANLAHPGGNITGFTVNDPAAGEMGAAIEGDRAAHRARGAAWLALPLGTLIALGQGQKPESTSGYAGSGGGFGAIKSAQNLTSRFLVITAPRPKSSVIVPVASHGGVARIVGDVVVARIIAVAVAVDVGVPPRRWIPPVAGPF